MALSKPLYHIISENLWTKNSQQEKKRLFELLVAIVLIQVATLGNLVVNFFKSGSNPCHLCDIGLVVLAFLALMCLLGNRLNCTLNTLFAVPVFVYAYFI